LRVIKRIVTCEGVRLHDTDVIGEMLLRIVAHLVRLDLICGENFAQRALSKIGETFVSHRRTMFVNVPR
jgi:hypothetical protein